MFKASRAKKALAVLLAVLLLASCLAVAGVSAATVVRMQTDYETAMSQYGETSAATNNVYKDAVKVRRCAQAGIGHNGSDGAMEIAFSGDTALPGAFRIFGSGVSAIEKGTAGTIYRVTFWYKVAALTGDAALTVGYGSANWSDDVAAAARAGIVRASRKLTAADVSDTWVEYSAVFKADAGNPQGFHVMLNMSGAATKAGTLLYVDDVTVEELPAGSTFAVHLDTAGGDSLPDVTGEIGSLLSVSALPVPTRAGYYFDRWVMADGSELSGSIVLQGTPITLKAVWIAEGADVTLTYVTNGGTAVAPTTAKAGQAVTAVTTRSGYVFDGWFAEAECRTQVTVYPPVSTTVYAGWRQKDAAVQSFETVGSLDGLGLGATLSTAQSHTGAKAVQITATAIGSEKTPRVFFLDANNAGIVLTVGKTYVATAWVWAEQAVPNAKLRVMNDHRLDRMEEWYGNRVQSETRMDLPAGRWVRLQSVFTATASPQDNETSFTLSFGVANADGDTAPHTIYIDDLSVAEYQVPQVVRLQDYEGYEAKKYDNGNADGINGNGSGRTVVSGIAHSGDKSVGMYVNRDNKENVARTMLTFDGQQFRGVTGQSYTIRFWAMCETAQELQFGISSTGSLNLYLPDTRCDLEAGSASTYTLEAGVWKQLAVSVPKIEGFGGAQDPYLLLNVWFTGANDNTAKTVYIDDVSLTEEYREIVTDAALQGFESGAAGETIGLQGVTLSDEVNYTAIGEKAACFAGSQNSGYNAPQLLLSNGQGEALRMKKNFSADISFWLYAKENTTARLWLAADDRTDAYTDAAQLDAARLAEQAVELTAGVWQKVTLHLPVAENTGRLRLGLAADNAQALWLDDLLMRQKKQITYDPNATVQDYENFTVGDGLGNNGEQPFFLNGTGGISDRYNHTQGEDAGQSLRVHAFGIGGLDRAQIVLIDPRNGQPLEAEKGVAYTVGYYVYMAAADSQGTGSLRLNDWICSTDDISGKLKSKAESEWDAGGVGSSTIVACNRWVKIKRSFVVKNGKYLVMGITNAAVMDKDTDFYLDDLTVEKAGYVTVHYEGNAGGDTVEELPSDTRAIIGELLAERPQSNPYRNGYEFTGWYTDPACGKDTLFDLQFDVVQGNDGDTLPLYAGWKKWSERPAREEFQPQPIYEERTVTERTWIGDSVEEPVIDIGDSADVKAAEAIKTQPDKPKDDGAKPGTATWLIVILVIAAVAVVGGGAAVTLLLLKKKAQGGKQA